MSESPLPSIPVESITSRIFLIRGQKVILESDPAKLYGVEPKVFLIGTIAQPDPYSQLQTTISVHDFAKITDSSGP